MARVYGVDERRVTSFVEDFAELGNYFDMPVATYSSGMRARLAFGISLAIDFDVYIVDEVIAVGDARFQAKCQAAFAERIRHASVILVSHSFETLQTYCTSGIMLAGGEFHYFEKLSEALSAYKSMLRIDALE